MGFQSSFNQLLATASAAALGAKHVQGQKASNKMSALNMAESLQPQIKEHNENFVGEYKNLMAAQNGGYEIKKNFVSGKMSEEAFAKALEAQNNEITGRIKQLTDLSARADILKQKRDVVSELLGKSNTSAYIEKPIGLKGKELGEFLKMQNNKTYEKAGKE